MKIILMLFLGLLISLPVFSQEILEEEEEKFELKSLSRKVNTRYHDSAPLVSPDGKSLYFTVNDHPDNTQGKGSQDIWYSELDSSGNWSKAEHLRSPLNQNKFNQALSLSPDGNTLLIRGGAGRDKLGFSLCTKVNGVWQKPIPQDIEGYNKMCKGRFNGAFMARDNSALMLYFNETEQAKYSDLYISFPKGQNSWTKPVGISTLNTRLDEFGPYLAPDNKTLFFASNRPGGFGNADIYRTVRKDDTWQNWSTPENIGQPVNTGGFDAYYAIGNADTLVFTTRAHMSADGGHLDIYSLKRIPKKKALLTLVTLAADLKTGETISTSNISISLDNKSLDDLYPMEDGSFEMELATAGNYKLEANAEGYLTSADSFTISIPKNDSVIYKTIYLQALEVGLAVRLNNIFFDFDKTTLRSESFPELDKVVTLMKENPSLFIEIGGHTDDKGSDEYNANLSQGRAEAVRNYLTSKWIATNRVTAKGYGESMPEVANDSEENQQINRRVVFTVLQNDTSYMVSE